VNVAEQMIAVKIVELVLVPLRHEAQFELFFCRRQKGICSPADGKPPIEISLAQ